VFSSRLFYGTTLIPKKDFGTPRRRAALSGNAAADKENVGFCWIISPN